MPLRFFNDFLSEILWPWSARVSNPPGFEFAIWGSGEKHFPTRMLSYIKKGRSETCPYVFVYGADRLTLLSANSHHLDGCAGHRNRWHAHPHIAPCPFACPVQNGR